VNSREHSKTGQGTGNAATPRDSEDATPRAEDVARSDAAPPGGSAVVHGEHADAGSGYTTPSGGDDSRGSEDATAHADAMASASGRHPTLRLAGGAGISFFGKLSGRLVQIVVQVTFARLLEMDDFGRFALGMTMVRMVGLIAPLGLLRGAVVFGARYWMRDPARFKGVVLETAGLAALSGTICAVAIAGYAGDFPALFPHNAMPPPQVLRAFAWIIPLFALLLVVTELTRVSQRMQFGTLAQDIVQPVVALAAFAALYVTGARLGAAVGATAVSYACSCAVAVFFLWRLFPESLRAQIPVQWNLKEILAFMGPTSLGVIAGVCCAMLDRMIVGAYRPPQDMALYQAASQVSVASTIILGSFTSIFGPMAARSFAAGDHLALQKLVRTSTNWGLYLALPLFAFLVVMPGTILGVTFGNSYAPAATALVVLATGQLINVGAGSVSVLLVISGNQTRWMALAVAATVVNAVTGLLLVASWGIVGAAVGNLLANLVLFGGGTLVIRSRLQLWPYERRTLKLALSAAAALVAGRLILSGLTSLAPIVQLAAVAAAVLASFAACSVALGVDEDERLLARALLRRIRPTPDASAL